MSFKNVYSKRTYNAVGENHILYEFNVNSVTRIRIKSDNSESNFRFCISHEYLCIHGHELNRDFTFKSDEMLAVFHQYIKNEYKLFSIIIYKNFCKIKNATEILKCSGLQIKF